MVTANQLILKVLLNWKSVSVSLLDFQPSQNEPVHPTNVIGGILHLIWVLLSFWCPSCAIRPSCVRIGSFDVCNLHVVPNGLRNRRGRSSLRICFLGQRFLFLCIFEQKSRINVQYSCSEDDPCRFPRLVCSTTRSCTSALMTREPLSLVSWALFFL